MRSLFLAALLVGCPATLPEDTDGDTDLTPVDSDADGFASDVDCDDDNADVNPDADELCNGIDDNCDEVVDTDAIDRQTVYLDTDGDSFGDPATEAQVCPDGLLDAHVDNDQDCNDNDDAINPDAQEVCDLDDVDEDCDGNADDLDDSTDPSTMRRWYSDLDGDGYGNPNDSGLQCDGHVGQVSDNTDCDDNDASANPDLGCPSVWDGTWEGKIRFDLRAPDFGIVDYCAGEGRLVIEAGAGTELTTEGGRPWTCSGVEAMGTVGITGSFVDADTIEGEFDLDGELFAFTAELSEDEGLVAVGTETRTIEDVTIVLDHDMSASPVE